MAQTLTASGRKTATGAVGDTWDLAVKATTVPEADADSAHPVRFLVNRPNGEAHTVVATTDGDVHAATFVLDQPGHFTATAVVVDADGAPVESLDGFKATAAESDDPGAESPVPVDPATTPDEPDAEPDDAA